MLAILFRILVKQWRSNIMWWFIIGFVIFIVILGIISSAVEQRRDEEFVEETSKQLGKAAEWWYGKNKKD